MSVCVSVYACVQKGDSFFVLDMIRIFSINAPYFGRWKKKFEKEEHCLVVGVGGDYSFKVEVQREKEKKIFEEKVVAFVVFFFFSSKKPK